MAAFDIRFDYDANDQLVSAAYGDGGRASFTYDEAGNLVAIASQPATAPVVHPQQPVRSHAGKPMAQVPPTVPQPPAGRPAPATVLVADSWVLHVRPSGGASFKVPLVSLLHVGRANDCGVVLQDVKASRHHAQIAPCPGGFCVQDLGSGNGTFVNGQRISTPTLLRHGDSILIGETVIDVRRQGLDPDATVIAR